MKKFKMILMAVVLSVVLVGCGSKAETETFTQTAMEGVTAEIMIEHEGDKVTNVSAKAIFDNELLSITDEETAEIVVDAFKASSALEDVDMTYSEKETSLTYTAPAELVDEGASFKDAEESLTSQGFKKK